MYFMFTLPHVLWDENWTTKNCALSKVLQCLSDMFIGVYVLCLYVYKNQMKATLG